MSRLLKRIRFREVGCSVPQLERVEISVAGALPGSSAARAFAQRFAPSLKYHNPEARVAFSSGAAPSITAFFTDGRPAASWDPAKV